MPKQQENTGSGKTAEFLKRRDRLWTNRKEQKAGQTKNWSRTDQERQRKRQRSRRERLAAEPKILRSGVKRSRMQQEGTQKDGMQGRMRNSL